MIDCVEECSVLKFQHGPLLRFGDVSVQCRQGRGCYATYFHAADTLFYISEKGIRGVGLKESVFKTISLSCDGEESPKSLSKPEILHTFSSATTEDYTDTILKQFSLNCIKLNQAETYAAFVIDPETRSENDPYLIICELHRNKPFFQNHIELYLNMEDHTNDQGVIQKSYVTSIQWTHNDELLVLASNGLLYLVCTKPSTKLSGSESSSIVESGVFILRFPKKITCFSTSIESTKTSSSHDSASCVSSSQQDLSCNVLLACATTANQIYALSVSSNGTRAQNGTFQWKDPLDVSVLQDTLTNVLYSEKPLDLSKCYITNCQCVSPNGLQWILVICYIVDEDNSDDSVFPDVLHVFVTLSCDLLCIEKCMGVVLNEIQVGINKKNIMSSIQHSKTCIVCGEDISSFFLSSSCAPDIALVSSSPSLVTDSKLSYIIVKPPEAYQLCCDQVDFETPVGCVDIIYIPKYPLSVPLTHVTLDTPPLINPSLVLLLQSDNVISCHYVDSQVSSPCLLKDECENDPPQFIEPLSHFFMGNTTSHGRLIAAMQKTSGSHIKKPSGIISSSKKTLQNVAINDPALEQTESTAETKNLNKAKIIETDSKKEKQKTVEQHITEIESFKENSNANKEIKKVLADGLRAYELEVKDLEREMKSGVPSSIEDCMVNCKNQIDIQKESLQRIERKRQYVLETLQEFQSGPVDTLDNLFKEIIDSRGLMSSYRKHFCDALKLLKNLMHVRQNKTFSFSCNATTYRYTAQECLKYLTLLQHTGNTQLSLLQSTQHEPHNSQRVALYTESLKCIQRIKNLFYSVLSLLDMISIRSENFENSANNLDSIAKEQRARCDNSGRRYALDYSVLDTLSAPEKLTDTLSNTPSRVSLENDSALSTFHTKTLKEITFIHKRLRELQFKSRQLNYEFLSFSSLQGTDVNQAECFEENMWKLMPRLPLESNIIDLLKQERYCEKSNALLLFESTCEELEVSKQFLKLVSGQKTTNSFENNLACRQKYFDFLEEEINNLQKRQTHITSTTDPLQTSFLQLLNGIQSNFFKSGLESTGPLIANKAGENEDLCLHVENKAISHFTTMPTLRDPPLGISDPLGFQKTNVVNTNNGKTTQLKHPFGSVTQVSNTPDVNEQPSCAHSTIYQTDKNKNISSFLSSKNSLISKSMKSENISPAVSQETFSFVDSTNKDTVSDIDDESSMKTSSDVGVRKSNEDRVTEKTETGVFNPTKDSGDVAVTNLVFRNPLTTSFTNCAPSPSLISPVIETTTTTNATNQKSEETEPQSTQSTPMQLDSQIKSCNDSTFQNNGAPLKLDTAPILESSAFERKLYSFGLDPVIPTIQPSVGVQNEKNSSWAAGLIKSVPSQEVSFFDQARSVTNSTNSFPVVNDSFTIKNVNKHLPNNIFMGNQNSSTFGVFGAPRSTPTDTISFKGFGTPHSTQKETSSFGGFGALQNTTKDTSLFGAFAQPQSASKDTPTFGSFPLASVNPPNPFPSPSAAFGKPLPSNTATTSTTDLKNLFSGPSVVDVGSYRIPDTMN